MFDGKMQCNGDAMKRMKEKEKEKKKKMIKLCSLSLHSQRFLRGRDEGKRMQSLREE